MNAQNQRADYDTSSRHGQGGYGHDTKLTLSSAGNAYRHYSYAAADQHNHATPISANIGRQHERASLVMQNDQ